MEQNLITANLIDNIISAYNKTAKANLQYQSAPTRDAVFDALMVADKWQDVQSYVWEHAKKEQHLKDLMLQYTTLKKAGALGTAPAQPAPAPVREMTADEIKFTSTVDLLGDIVVKALAEVKSKDIESAVTESMKNEIRQFIKDEYGPIKRKIEVTVGSEMHEIHGTLHAKFPQILELITKHFYPYLVGPSGTGKSYICRQIAEVLGLEFYFTNAVTQEYQLKGFTTANGEYQETQFYKAFKNGGIFLIDELDGSIPEALLIINDALANGYFDFPAPIGKVMAHPNFITIAAGNTYGNGATSEYTARNQLDTASMDRFKYIEIDYDTAIEDDLSDGDKELVGFIRAYRKAIKSHGIQAIATYRAISGIAALKDSKVMTLSEVIKSCLTKGLEPSDLRLIKSDVSGYGKYSTAFNELCE